MTHARFGSPHSSGTEQAGVGIIFKPSFNSECFMALVVHDLVKGSSADRLGAIMRGDILQSIDGVDVFKRPAQEVSGVRSRSSCGLTLLFPSITTPATDDARLDSCIPHQGCS